MFHRQDEAAFLQLELDNLPEEEPPMWEGDQYGVSYFDIYPSVSDCYEDDIRDLKYSLKHEPNLELKDAEEHTTNLKEKEIDLYVQIQKELEKENANSKNLK